MTTLYQRAGKRQRVMLRMVEGAIKNASDAHPQIVVAEHLRRSIAKRAVGMMSAAMPALLSSRPSERARPTDRAEEAVGTSTRRKPSPLLSDGRGPRPSRQPGTAGGAARVSAKPLPLQAWVKMIEHAAWKALGPLQREGDLELYDAILRVVVILGSRRKGWRTAKRAA